MGKFESNKFVAKAGAIMSYIYPISNPWAKKNDQVIIWKIILFLWIFNLLSANPLNFVEVKHVFF